MVNMVDLNSIGIIFRLLTYAIALYMVLRLTYISERPPGDGAKAGLRLILVPLAIAHFTYIAALITNLTSGVIYARWLFEVSSLVTIAAMIFLNHWLNSPQGKRGD